MNKVSIKTIKGINIDLCVVTVVYRLKICDL